MRRLAVCLSLLAFVGLVAFHTLAPSAEKEKDDPFAGWSADFAAEKADLVATGRNPYFILEPGYVLVLAGGGEEVTITVLAETRMLDGVETRVVEERGTKGGQIGEVARNYFAISKRTNSVFYFGEDVDNYKNGKVIYHDGSWLSGVKGARFGLVMPGTPLVGGRYYQEVARGVAMDRAEIVATDATVVTPAGTFKHSLKTEESTPLEGGKKSSKYYAPGVGLVQDGDLKLIKTSPAPK
jgi:hypothetical protein